MAFPLWRPGLFPAPQNSDLASWLTEPDSLTARCEGACRQFRIRVLGQGQGSPTPDEMKLFRLRPGQRTWIREVLLECDGVPVIYGHTVLPLAPRGRLTRWLAGLGSRSLGSLLFSHPGFCRGPIEFRRLDRRHPLFARAARAAGPGDTACFWARRSTHSLDGQTVLVTEVFLPSILRFEA